MTRLVDQVGGAVVALAFTMGQRRVTPGMRLSAEEFLGMPNGKALVRAGYLKTHPPAGAAEIEPAKPASVFSVHIGAGKYDVIAGHKLNAEPLTKDEAEALARGH